MTILCSRARVSVCVCVFLLICIYSFTFQSLPAPLLPPIFLPFTPPLLFFTKCEVSYGYQPALEYQVSGTLGASTTEADSGAQIGEKGLKASSVVGDRLLFLHEDPAEQVIHISIHPCALVGSSASVNTYGSILVNSVGFLMVSLTPLTLSILPSHFP